LPPSLVYQTITGYAYSHMSDEHEGQVSALREAARPQFSTVHAMRGIAALWVVLFHSRNFGAFLWSGLGRGDLVSLFLFDYGRGGVAIFFVLSGFVIAHSLWRVNMTGRSVAQFMLRRSVRLDPPYWASIALTLFLLSVRQARHGADISIDPSVVLANLLYLQEFLKMPEIQVVYWTLTYEIQFYFVYALLLWWLSFAQGRRLPSVVRAAPAAALLVAAFAAAAEHHEWVMHGLFLNFWHAFAAGVLAYLGGFRRSNVALVLCFALSVLMLVSAPSTTDVFNSPAALTAMLLAFLGRFNKLSSFARGPFKSLGTISYSLYLVHVPAIFVLVSLSAGFFGNSVISGAASFVSVVVGCVLAASAFWWAIERPSHGLARRIGRGKRPDDHGQTTGPGARSEPQPVVRT
jgi:peptidoglycan/LPS O-acetylase OafA/YrhL